MSRAAILVLLVAYTIATVAACGAAVWLLMELVEALQP